MMQAPKSIFPVRSWPATCTRQLPCFSKAEHVLLLISAGLQFQAKAFEHEPTAGTLPEQANLSGQQRTRRLSAHPSSVVYSAHEVTPVRRCNKLSHENKAWDDALIEPQMCRTSAYGGIHSLGQDRTKRDVASQALP